MTLPFQPGSTDLKVAESQRNEPCCREKPCVRLFISWIAQSRDAVKEDGVLMVKTPLPESSRTTRLHRRWPWTRFAGEAGIDDPDASSSVDNVVYGRDRP